MNDRRGSIEPLPSGRLRVRVTGPDGRRGTIGTCDTRDEAEELLVAALAELDASAPVAGDTLGAFGPRFLDRRELRGVRNVGTERVNWKNHVEPSALAELPMKSITRRDVLAFVRELEAKRIDYGRAHRRNGKRLARQTRANILGLVRGALDEALRDGLIEHNPAHRVELAREGARHEPWTFLLPDEQRALLTCHSIPEPDRLLVAFALGTGLRSSEQWRLRLVDLSLEAGDEHVIVRFGKRGKPPKSGKVRRVALFGVALDAVRRWLKLLPTYAVHRVGARRERASHNPIGLLFPGRKGGRRSDGKPVRAWSRYLELAGLAAATRRHDGRPVRWHDLRHTCASSMVAGWWGRRWRLEEVREQLGHSTIKVTERYAHLAAGVVQEAAVEADAAFRGRGGPSGASTPPPPSSASPARSAPPGGAAAAGALLASTSRPARPQVCENAAAARAFVNRRSRVQVSKVAPGGILRDSAAEITSRGRARGRGELAAWARRLLLALAAGEPVERADAHELARGWLELVGGDLAIAVLAGGAYEADRLVDLCELVARLVDGARSGGESC